MIQEADKKPPQGRALAVLSLGALGVVYGDIGTSPLYALKECFTGHHSIDPTPTNVLGVMSLVFWAMTFVVSFKYLGFVMKADNRGEGGILALLALVGQRDPGRGARRMLILAGLFGAALLYGDGIITPAISVLGAVEGVSVAAPAFQHFIVPISLVIIVLLFGFQKRGTAAVGAVFGPVMLLWFACIAVLGIRGIMMDPSILRAISPLNAIEFFREDGLRGFLILGSVVLVITGGEALYADMGHFGRRPIRLAWFTVAMPALMLNYFGQAALILRDPAAAANPFYHLVPGWALYPMIIIATAAAIVASQALISGAFSLTRQAVQLGYAPRVTITHTSRTEIGQIYVPQVNAALGVGCVALILGFQSSSNLAAAYGIAVTGTMIMTTILFHRVARERFGWSRARTWPLTAVFLLVDVSFFGANLVKIEEGGWFPLVVATVIFALMTTWKKGREVLNASMRESSLPMGLFLDDISRRRPQRVPGCAVFMTSDTTGAPPVLLHHLKHNKVLHEKVVLVSVVTEEIPQVADRDRVMLKDLGHGFWQVIAHYGFMESPDVPEMLRSLEARGARDAMGLGGLIVKPMETTFYLGRETLLPGGPGPLARWRKALFILMARNALPATQFFSLPPNRVVEMGAQIQL
ncbi:MAG: potassium transporter Kup [Gemmatimonadales bacterium]